jgi:hypothetical protein
MWKAEFVTKQLNQRYSTTFTQTYSRDPIDWIFLLMIVLTLLLLIGLPAALIFRDYQLNKNCAMWQDKIVHQDAYTQFIPMWSGKMMFMMPIYHAAGDYQQSVCVKPK